MMTIHAHPTVLVSLVCFGSLLASCAGFQHGYTLGQFKGQVVPARDGRGADRLQTEVDYDATIRAVVQTQGAPDYILVESGNAVKLMYVAEDRVLSFQRGWGTNSRATIDKGIPEYVTAFFTETDRRRLVQLRGESSRGSASASVPTRPSSTVMPEEAEARKDQSPKATKTMRKPTEGSQPTPFPQRPQGDMPIREGETALRVKPGIDVAIIRGEPSPFSPEVGRITSGSRVVGLQRRGSWYAVRTAKGEQGYVESSAVEEVK